VWKVSDMAKWKAAGIADWWDDQHRAAGGKLNQFIEQHPDWFGVMVATTFNTALDLTDPAFDSLRFGEGLATGGVGGIATDAVRLIGLMGPLGKLGKAAQIFSNQRLARAIIDPGGPNCGWVSGTMALRQVGAKRYASVGDLAKAMGLPLDALGVSLLSTRARLFRALGAKVSPLTQISSWEQIEKMTPRDGSVVMVSVAGIRWTAEAATESLEVIGKHAIYAFRDFFGRIRIMDRGSEGNPGKIFSSLTELAAEYKERGVQEFIPVQAAVLENVFGKLMDEAGKAAVLAMGLRLAVGVSHKVNEAVAQAFEIFKMRATQSLIPTLGDHTVVAGETLAKIATARYGDENKWTVIYEANRDAVGKDLSIAPNQRLLIPNLPRTPFPLPQPTGTPEGDDDARQAEEARKRQDDATRKAQEDAARKAQEDAARKAQEDAAARKAQDDATRKAQEDAARKAQEDAARKAQDEAARKAQDDAVARKAQEDAAARKAQDDAVARKAQDDAAAGKAQDDGAARKAQDDAVARKAQDDAARKAQADAARKAQDDAAARKAQEDAARKAQEDAARKAQADAARKAQEDAARKAQEDARFQEEEMACTRFG